MATDYTYLYEEYPEVISADQLYRICHISKVNYMSLIDKVDAPEAKLLVSACQLCMEADYQALGLGNQFGDFEGEIQAKYAGLKDGSKTVDNVVSELDAVIAAS